MQLIAAFTPSSGEIIIIILLCAVIALLLLLYRRFPIHLIYRSKIGIESMLDALNEPLAVISNDFTVKRVNKAYVEMTGHTYRACINSKCYWLLRGRDAPCEDCLLTDALKASSPLETAISAHPSGNGAVTITFSPYAMPVIGGETEIYIIEHIRDITALETLKNDLERRNKFLINLSSKLRAAQLSVKSELRVARQIQLGLLPPKISHIGKLRVDMTYRPATDVGGDLYDFVPLDDNRVGVFVGDASGHGLASSLIGTLSKMSLYNHSRATNSTSELLELMNRDLKAHIHTSHYLTCFWCIFDFETNRLKYSRAGHPIQIALKKDGTLHGLSGNGIFLGITDDAVYEENEFTFETGDRFYLFTDGVYDVFLPGRKNDAVTDYKESFLGYAKFTELVKRTAGMPFNEIIKSLQDNLTDYEFDDDYTLIVAEVC